MNTSELSPAWVPEACRLPTAAQPLRVAEFAELFATSVRNVERIEPTRLRLVLDPSAAARTAELMVRETRCCAFFGFVLTAADRTLRLDIAVPPGQVAVLDALNVRTATGARS